MILLCFDTKLEATWGFPGGSDDKESACSVGDPGSVPGSGTSPREGNGNPLQYSCLGIPWTEEPGGYNPWGCRVRHDLVLEEMMVA